MNTIQDRNPSSHIVRTFDDSRLVINLSGKFGLMNLSDFSAAIKKLLKTEADTDRVDFDFSGVSYIDSAAALAMVSLQKECAARNV
ncbi:MAG: STAS domain-containing protein, partial [Deltaproteobacteria bacterium]|nr:STAS domain-containing protein [Deltaproteobacteria bacterium]